jgi:IS4 transposase
MDILALLQHLSPYLEKTTIRQMSRIIPAMLAMTGRVTMLGISRWAEKGGSYRTIQRFFHTAIPWATVFWLFFQRHLLQGEETYLLAGDECVVTKAGKQTHGLDRFFSSLYGKPVPSLAFFALSLVGVSERRSYPMMLEQVVRTAEEKAQVKAKAEVKKARKKQKTKRKPGRPKGKKNRDKTKVTLTSELTRIQAMVNKLLAHIDHALQINYLVMDGKFGNNNALQMTLQTDLHLISKLRCDSALYYRYDGPYSGKGRHRKYGDKVDYDNLPVRYLKAIKIGNEVWTSIYGLELLHKEFSQALNVVIIVKTNMQTGARARVILFSSDPSLRYDQIIEYYRLRFQIEFNFRDAKQYWGLEDFMNVKETAVTNAANLSLFMVNVAHLLLRDFRAENSNVNVLDLKAHFRGLKYVTETLKWLPKKPKPILMARIINKVSLLGRVHNPLPSYFPS